MEILNSELTGVFSPQHQTEEKEENDRTHLKTHSDSLPNPESTSKLIQSDS